MMHSHVECPRCLKALWHATGRFTHSRRGLRRAECRCESCAYLFQSARPEAIQAGEVVAAGLQQPEMGIVADLPNLHRQPRRERVRGFTRVTVMAHDYKKRAAGDDSEL